MPSFSAWCFRFYFEWIMRAKAINLSPEKTRARVDEGYIRPKPFHPPTNLGSDLTIERVDVTGWPLYRVSAAPAGTPTKSRPAMVYIHGGSFFVEILEPHWRFIAQVARETKLDVLVPIYPLLPHPKATTAQHIEGFLELYANSPQPVVAIAGDSAGGHLSLLSMQQLLERDPKLAKTVRCLVLISPCLDISLTHPDLEAQEARDPWLATPGLRPLTKELAGGLPLKDPRCSPLYGNIEGLPPVLMMCGTDDMICADTRRLSGKYQGKGTEVGMPGSFKNDKLTYIEMPNMMHVYPLLPHWEGGQARLIIMDYLRECTK